MTTICRLNDDELGLLVPLFESVFKVPASLDLLHWKYALGHGVSWTAWQQNSLVLHCGVFYREVLLHGVPTQAAQLVDLMAAPKQSGLARLGSPFSILLQTILASLASPSNPDGLAFGFPSGRAMKLAEHAGVSTSVDDWMELEFRPLGSLKGAQARLVQTWSAAEDETVNILWNQMRDDLCDFVVGVRNSDYVKRRYRLHPNKKYKFIQIASRWWHRPIGFLVLGPGQNRYEIVDLICPLENIEEVIRATQHWLRQTNGELLSMMITSTFASQMVSFASQCTTTQFKIMANPLMPVDTLNKLHRRWWLTGGDTDYR
jgi:hypothetical protein